LQTAMCGLAQATAASLQSNFINNTTQKSLVCNTVNVNLDSAHVY